MKSLGPGFYYLPGSTHFASNILSPSPQISREMVSVLSSPAEYETLLSNYDTWLFDCDGVLWRGDQVIDGAIQALSILRQRGKEILLLIQTPHAPSIRHSVSLSPTSFYNNS